MQKQHRPTGVTIVAILTIIGGLVLLFSGVALIALGALIPSLVSNNTTNSPFSHASAQLLGIIAAAIGSVLLAVGIGYLVMFYGLLKGKGWAWTITIVLLIIGIAIHIASTAFGSVFTASTTSLHNNNGNSGIVGAIIGIAIDIVILYYLYRPHVKAYFGKTKHAATI
ncbi:MAG TPA: hypothetical protein VFD60_10045 [Nitrososphaeraceae archaeon]|nr:hypothetical protein [Nitrososphaeraceae archaeon]